MSEHEPWKWVTPKIAAPGDGYIMGPWGWYSPGLQAEAGRQEAEGRTAAAADQSAAASYEDGQEAQRDASADAARALWESVEPEPTPTIEPAPDYSRER